MTTWIGATPLTNIGMTEEKYTLLRELAQNNEYWAVVLSTIDAVAHLKLTSLSNSQRVRLALIILELDVALYAKSWGQDVPGRFAQSSQKVERTTDSFSRMRNLLKSKGPEYGLRRR